MKTFFDYYQNKRCEFTVTVCTAYDPKTRNTARGVSVCSPKDEPNFDKGEQEALNYVKRAMLGRRNKPIDCPEAIKVISKTDCPFVFHSELQPRLTFKERKELFGNYSSMENMIPLNLKINFSKIKPIIY